MWKRGLCHSQTTQLSGSWRARHLKKRAHILRTKVFQGDWLLPHAHAGQRASSRFGNKSFVIGEIQKAQSLDGNVFEWTWEKERTGDFKEWTEARKAQGSQSRSCEDSFESDYPFCQIGPSEGRRKCHSAVDRKFSRFNSIIHRANEWTAVLAEIVFMIFIFALLTDSTLAWMMIYPYLHRVTLVESRHGFLPRPSFLTHPLPEHDPSTERSTAPQPRRREPMMGVASTSAAEPAAAASTSAAVPAAAASTSAVPAAAASSSTVPAAVAFSSAGHPAASSSAGHHAASPSAGADRRAEPAAGRVNFAATAAESSSQSRSQTPKWQVSCQGNFLTSDSNGSKIPLWFRMPRFEKRKAPFNLRSVSPVRASTVYRSVVNLYSLEFEHALHSDVNHVSGGEVKEYTACVICMKG